MIGCAKDLSNDRTKRVEEYTRRIVLEGNVVGGGRWAGGGLVSKEVDEVCRRKIILSISASCGKKIGFRAKHDPLQTLTGTQKKGHNVKRTPSQLGGKF